MADTEYEKTPNVLFVNGYPVDYDWDSYLPDKYADRLVGVKLLDYSGYADVEFLNMTDVRRDCDWHSGIMSPVFSEAIDANGEKFEFFVVNTQYAYDPVPWIPMHFGEKEDYVKRLVEYCEENGLPYNA